MATYSNNVTTKVGSNITLSASGGGGSFSYTVPSGSLAQISRLSYVTPTSGSLTITYPNGTQRFITAPATIEETYTPFMQFPAGTTFVASTGTGSDSIRISGMLLTNTP